MSLLKSWTDWSHPINPGMQVFGASWHRQVTFEQLGSIAAVQRRTSQIHIGSHSGTHIDAPSHFVSKGKSIDEVELWRFEGLLHVVDLSFVEPGTAVQWKDLTGRLPSFLPQSVALGFYFGWAHRYGTPNYFSEQPFFSREAAEKIAAREPKLVAYDIAMPDNPLDGFGATDDSPVHKIFLSRGIPLAENLNMQGQISEKLRFIAVPLGLSGLDGSPVRFLVGADVS